jgi:hypothetical protein
MTMDKTRVILKRLIEESGLKAYDIQRQTGIRTSSIYRFLDGTYSSLEWGTLKKLADFFHVTEAQLRGEAKIDGIELPPHKPELKNLVSATEYKLLLNIKKLDSESQGIVQRLTEKLSESQEQSKGIEEKEPNSQLRVGETRYRAPAKKNRIKEHVNAPKQTGTS